MTRKHAKVEKPRIQLSPINYNVSRPIVRPRPRIDDKNRRLHRFRKQLVASAEDLLSLWIPVSVSLVTACIMTWIRGSVRPDGVRVVLKSEVGGVIASGVIASGLQQWQLMLIVSAIALVFIVCMTFAMVVLLSCNCFACLKYYICVAFLLITFNIICFWFYTASAALLIPVDWITFVILTYNLIAMVTLCMAASDRAPKRLIQLVHILLSASIAYMVSNAVMQGSFAYASILCLTFSAWDLFAVLCPRGPLNSMIKMAEREDRVVDFMQPLVYTAAVWMVTMADNGGSGGAVPEEGGGGGRQGRERPKRGSRLGLGDFIFYGILMATAGSQCGLLGALTCYVALSVGFSLTLLALQLLDRALPALPVPVATAVMSVALLSATGQHYSATLAGQQLML